MQTCVLIGLRFLCSFEKFLRLSFCLFHVYGDVTITREGLKISTYARHSFLMKAEGLIYTVIKKHVNRSCNGRVRSSAEVDFRKLR